MRKLGLGVAAAAILALAACSSGEAGEAEAGAAAEQSAAEAAELAEPIDYVKDIGLLEDGFGETLNARLAAFHEETGHEIRIAVILTTDDQDIEEKAAEMIESNGMGDDGALILIAAADERIGIVPAPGAAAALDAEFTDATEAAMAARFDAGDVTDGFNGAVDAIIDRLGR
ncbi:MAG: TPM domain-containing protein [Parasphingopyxis sp.]